MTPAEKNALAVNQYLNFLADMLRQRLKNYFNQESSLPKLSDVKKIVSIGDDSELSSFIREFALSPEEIIVLLLAIAPHIRPDFFYPIISQHLSQPGDFPQIGGIRGKNFRGFLPSGETALFLLAGDEINKRFELLKIFSTQHIFSRDNIVRLEEAEPGDPLLSGRLEISKDYLELFTQGHISRPRMSMDFPAEYITTELNNEDLVLSSNTIRQITELENWVKHHETMMKGWKMKRWIKPGYRVLFHGPPGTGKTLTALILGKKTGKDVYRIDLSVVVSKYIGETEKNLSRLFERAKSKDWILFFDEADALFGKRTNVRDAHDKYANQEVAYLLQRIESHDGLVILASNFKSNIDEAFIRRFQSVIYFPPPTIKERFVLWKKIFPGNLVIPPDEELLNLSKKYELTGASIVNVVEYCCLEALANGSKKVTTDQIQFGIEKEFFKEGKII